MRRIGILGAAILWAATGVAAQGQTIDGGVAAIVNDNIISTFDVEQRVQLRIMSSGQIPPADVLDRLRAQVLRDLVDEKLKLYEADRLGVDIPDAYVDQQLIDQLTAASDVDIRAIEQEFNRAGLSINSLREQIHAEIAWNELVRARFQNRLRISDEQVNRVMERMSRDANTTQFRVAEIFLPFESRDQAQQTYDIAVQLLQQMSQGTPFPAIAQQFSAAPSAAVGGDIGWVVQGQLPTYLDEVLQQIDSGQVSNPVVASDGIYLLALVDKREISGDAEWYQLVQAMTPIPAGANDREKRQSADNLTQFISAAGGCATADMAVSEFNDIQIAELDVMSGGDIDPIFLTAIHETEPGQATSTIEVDGAYHALFVCGRAGGRDLAEAMSKESIEDRLFEQQMSMLSRRYLRDLRRDSMVEFR